MFDAFSETSGVTSMGVWLETGMLLDCEPKPWAMNIIGLHLFVLKESDKDGAVLIARPLQECGAHGYINYRLFVSAFYHQAGTGVEEEKYLVREVLKEGEVIERALGENGFRRHFLLMARKEN